MKLDLETRCFTCNAFAYHDSFNGELGPSGYMCSYCVKALFEEAYKSSKRYDKTDPVGKSPT